MSFANPYTSYFIEVVSIFSAESATSAANVTSIASTDTTETIESVQSTAATEPSGVNESIPETEYLQRLESITNTTGSTTDSTSCSDISSIVLSLTIISNETLPFLTPCNTLQEEPFFEVENLAAVCASIQHSPSSPSPPPPPSTLYNVDGTLSEATTQLFSGTTVIELDNSIDINQNIYGTLTINTDGKDNANHVKNHENAHQHRQQRHRSYSLPQLSLMPMHFQYDKTTPVTDAPPILWKKRHRAMKFLRALRVKLKNIYTASKAFYAKKRINNENKRRNAAAVASAMTNTATVSEDVNDNNEKIFKKNGFDGAKAPKGVIKGNCKTEENNINTSTHHGMPMGYVSECEEFGENPMVFSDFKRLKTLMKKTAGEGNINDVPLSFLPQLDTNLAMHPKLVFFDPSKIEDDSEEEEAVYEADIDNSDENDEEKEEVEVDGKGGENNGEDKKQARKHLARRKSIFANVNGIVNGVVNVRGYKRGPGYWGGRRYKVPKWHDSANRASQKELISMLYPKLQ